MDKKCKILFFINTLSGGGAEKVLINLLKQLNPRKYEITLVTVTSGVYSTQVPPYVCYKNILHSHVAWINNLNSKIIHHIPSNFFCKLFLHGDFDIAVAYLEGFPTRTIAKLKTSASKVAFVHCDISVNNIIAPYYLSNEECHAEYSSFNKTCFVSRKALQGFERTIGILTNSTVIHNVQDVDAIMKLADEPAESVYSTNGLKILAIGRLTRPKRFDRLLEIAHRLQSKYSFEILILGEGEERKRLEEQMTKDAVTSVRLLGFRNNPYALMKQADLLICSSEFEGYSTVATEAMILGLPVLTTDCAGMDEILDNGKYGYIVKNDCDSLCTGLEKILSDREFYSDLKEKAKSGSQHLQIDNSIRDYNNLFSELFSVTH